MEYVNLPTLIARKKDMAEKIIFDEEWIDIEVIQCNATCAIIYNDRTNKKIKITPRDNEETLHKKIEESYK